MKPFYKKIISAFFLILIFCLIISTFLSQEAAGKFIYRAIWFKGLWGILAAGLSFSLVNLIRRKYFALAIVHAGIILILLGGFLSSFLGIEGFMEIKEGESMKGFWIEDDLFMPLDFSVGLKDFSVEYYPQEVKGMRFIKRFRTSVVFKNSGGVLEEGVIQVNRPVGFRGFLFYQYGHDSQFPDKTLLQVVKDPGVPFVYGGYLFLMFGLLTSFKVIWKI